MNEIREELERQFEALTPKEQEASTEEISEVIESPNGEDTNIEAVVCISAPKGYLQQFADDFKNLPLKWQTFLSKHEKENERAILEAMEKIKDYQWIDDVFAKHRTRLNKYGAEKAQRWMECLAFIDSQIEDRPLDTLRAIASVYDINLHELLEDKVPNTNQLIERIQQLEQGYHNLSEFLQKQQNRKLAETIHMFAHQKDDTGNLMHPYIKQVLPQLVELLQSGVVCDVAEAYNQALWLNPAIREELIAKKINSKAREAQKAKHASFTPKGKAQAPERELTLREELEKNMAALIKQ